MQLPTSIGVDFVLNLLQISAAFGDTRNTKVDDVKASMENDVLTVIVPKQPQHILEVRAIEISG